MLQVDSEILWTCASQMTRFQSCPPPKRQKAWLPSSREFPQVLPKMDGQIGGSEACQRIHPRRFRMVFEVIKVAQ